MLLSIVYFVINLFKILDIPLSFSLLPVFYPNQKQQKKKNSFDQLIYFLGGY